MSLRKFGSSCLVSAALGLLATAPAWAVITIDIVQPTHNQVIQPGDTVDITVNVTGAVAGLSRVTLSFYLETPAGIPQEIFDYNPFPPTNSDTIMSLSFVRLGESPGSKLFLRVDAEGWADDPVSASRNVLVASTGPDVTPPTYSGQAGIATAERVVGNDRAFITWNQGLDDRTFPIYVRYNIYWDTVLANVFSGAPEESVVGGTSMLIQGLDPIETYFVGVRAEDEAGNEETNTRRLEIAPLPNAVRGAWLLYR